MKIAEFKINRIIDLINRGPVLIGEIIIGEINSESMIQLVLNEKNILLKIKSVESVNYLQRQSEVGLLIDYTNKNLAKHLHKIIGETIIISSSNIP